MYDFLFHIHKRRHSAAWTYQGRPSVLLSANGQHNTQREGSPGRRCSAMSSNRCRRHLGVTSHSGRNWMRSTGVRLDCLFLARMSIVHFYTSIIADYQLAMHTHVSLAIFQCASIHAILLGYDFILCPTTWLPWTVRTQKAANTSFTDATCKCITI